MKYQPKDPFYRKAKKEGYRSRAAYKLLEINRRYRLLRPGNRVLDLGAAPGGWIQVAAQLVGAEGMVIGLDLNPIVPFMEKNVVLLQEDISKPETALRISKLLGGAADCVMSDLAPHLTGVRDGDVARAIDLFLYARDVAVRLLAPGGNFLAKTFLAQETNGLVAELKQHFFSISRTRPDATRKASSEIYIVAQGFNRAK